MIYYFDMRRKLLILYGVAAALYGSYGLLSLEGTFSFQGAQIYRASKLEPVPTPSPPPITFVFGGDVMLGRAVNATLVERNDYFYPFSEIAAALQAADFSFTNLESPIVENCPVVRAATFTLCAPPQAAEALQRAGIDAVSFANNHYLDYGNTGVRDTGKYLLGARILPIMQGNPEYVLVRGKRIGLLAFNLTWPGNTEAHILQLVTDTKLHADLVIVSFHWGDEYTDTPSESQKSLARAVIEHGADLIVGHHPHHLQPAERYKHGLIFYSLGNLVFDQMWSEKTRRGALVKVSWYIDNALELEILPTKIYEFSQPRFTDEQTRNEILAHMLGASGQ